MRLLDKYFCDCGAVLETEESAVERMFADIRERFGYLDFLINNSASGVNRAATDVEPKHWDWTLNVNARAAWCAGLRPSSAVFSSLGKLVVPTSRITRSILKVLSPAYRAARVRPMPSARATFSGVASTAGSSFHTTQ